MNNWNVADGKRAEQWEYARYLFNWQQNYMEINNQKVDWNGMWEVFTGLGADGWEMVSFAPVSASGFGHAPGDTNFLLFVFKRRKADSLI